VLDAQRTLLATQQGHGAGAAAGGSRTLVTLFKVLGGGWQDDAH
jgi:outer membrane protein TolC